MSDYDHAMKVNQQHKLINGKLQMQVSNLQFESSDFLIKEVNPYIAAIF